MALILLSNCVSMPEPEEEVFVAPSYTLVPAEPVAYQEPLPIKTSINIVWSFKDHTETKEAFRAWDINRDGKFDMIESLSESGETTGWAYDFNGDSKVDLQQASAKLEAKVVENNEANSSEGAPGAVIVKSPSLDEVYDLLKLSH